MGHPVELQEGHFRQPHDQVDHPKRKQGDQAQCEEVEGAFSLDPLVDLPDFVLHFGLDPVPEEEAGGGARQGRTDGAGEGDDQRPSKKPEKGPSTQR